MSPPPVRVVHQLARTGGTLVNRCLGSMRGVLVMSEVHPFDPQGKPVRQAVNWFGLLGRADFDWVRGLAKGDQLAAYGEFMALLAARARARGQCLVLRDWTHLDFLGIPFVADPPMELRTEKALSGHCRLLQAFIVRHPRDQFVSSKGRPGMAEQLTARRFMAAYGAFARLAAARDFLRYEDLVASPDQALERLCRTLQIPFDPGYRARWRDYDKVTGDNLGPSRGFEMGTIAPLPPRAPAPDLLAALRREPRYHESLRLLGYADDGPGPD